MKNKGNTIHGLIFGCPLEDEILMRYCIFNKVWQLQPKERIQFIQDLNHNEILEFERFHIFLECKKQNLNDLPEYIKDLIDQL